MNVIRVPYHLDEYVPALDLPLTPHSTVVTQLPAGDVWERLAALYNDVADEVVSVVSLGDRPLVVAGDCTTSLGIVAGLQRAGLDVGVVWFDAHGDLQTLETTTSGYLGGMPLRLLVGYRPELISQRLGLRPISEQRVVLVGARDLDPPEIDFLADSQVVRTDVESLRVDDVPGGDLYIHLDLDVLDPLHLPGLRFPAPGGPTVSRVLEALRALLHTGRVTALGVACTWHPGSGSGHRVNTALQVLTDTW